MSGSYPQPPSVRVNLNANILDCSNMKGGYSSWRLGPNGSQLSPVIQKNTAPYTTSGANALYLYGQDGAVDVYFPGSGADFNRGETITVQGGAPNQITFTGDDSTIQINFKYSHQEKQS